jgi:hypothetical protein
MRIAAALLLAAAACGPKAASTSSTPSNTPPGQPPFMVAGPCPAGEDLARLALQAWGKTGGTATAECVELRVKGEILWLVDGWHEPPESEDSMTVGSWSALVTPAGEVRWAEGDDELPFGALMKDMPGAWRAVDLDGDGTDEVLHELGYSHGGYTDTSLVVARIADGKLLYGNTDIPLSSDNSAAVEDEAEMVMCTGTWEVTPPDVSITYEGDCERPGRKVYRWNGTSLVETPAAN